MGYFPNVGTPMVADVVTPVMEGFAERRRRRLQDVKEERSERQEGRLERAEQRTIADRLSDAEKAKYDRERQERQDSIESKEKQLELDKSYHDWGRDLLSTANPDNPDDESFNQQVNDLGAQYERGLVEKYGHTPEEAHQKMENLFAAGNFSREGIKQMQIKMELREETDKSGGKVGTGSQKTFEAKIEKLLAVNPGLTEDEATGMVVGTTKIVTDPVSGESEIVNMVDNTSRPLKGETDQQEQPEVSEEATLGTTLWEDAELSTGPVSALRHGASVASGIVGGPVASQTEQARQRSKTSTNELIRALSINPRFPVGEINRIKEEISINPQVLDNPKLLRDRMIAIDESLKRRVKNEKRATKDRSLPVKQRREARRAVKDLEDFLDIMGVPPRYTPETYKDLSAGDQYIDPNGTLRIKKAK